MPPVKKQLIEAVFKSYNEQKKDIDKIGIFRNYPDQLLKSRMYDFKQEDIYNTDSIDKKAEVIALYMIVQDKINSSDLEYKEAKDYSKILLGNINDYFGITTLQVNSIQKMHNDPNVNLDKLVEVDFKGNVKNELTKEEKDKEVQDRINKRKEAELKEKQFEQEKAKKEQERIAKEKEEAEKGKEFWANLDNEVPKYDPNKKVEQEQPKIEYSKESVSSAAIDSYLKVAYNFMSGADKDSVDVGKDSKAYYKDLDQKDIDSVINQKELNVSNLIDKLALHKAQKEKLQSFGFFKRTFSFLFKDARQVKNNISNLESSFGDRMPKKVFQQLANSDRQGRDINNMVNAGFVSIEDDKTKSLFDENKMESRRETYLKTNDAMREVENSKVETYQANEKAHEEAIKETIAENASKIHVVIKDEEFEDKTMSHEEKVNEDPQNQKQLEVDDNVREA